MISFLDSLNVIGYEINLSCPHVSKMGMEIGDDPEMVSLIIRTIKRHTRKPISVKIGIGSMDVVEIARVAVESGADMITAINTVRAMKIDVQSMIPVLSNLIGGLSGKAIKPIGIRCVYEISKVLNVPVIGCGDHLKDAEYISRLQQFKLNVTSNSDGHFSTELQVD
jgi:dihydroorotate dehydrogenase (NAD+) catalytic subunit